MLLKKTNHSDIYKKFLLGSLSLSLAFNGQMTNIASIEISKIHDDNSCSEPIKPPHSHHEDHHDIPIKPPSIYEDNHNIPIQLPRSHNDNHNIPIKPPTSHSDNHNINSTIHKTNNDIKSIENSLKGIKQAFNNSNISSIINNKKNTIVETEKQFMSSFSETIKAGIGTITKNKPNSSITFESKNNNFAVNSNKNNSNSVQMAKGGSIKFVSTQSILATNTPTISEPLIYKETYNQDTIIDNIKNGQFSGGGSGSIEGSVPNEEFSQILNTFKKNALNKTWEEISSLMEKQGFDISGTIHDTFTIDLDSENKANIIVTGSWKELYSKMQAEAEIKAEQDAKKKADKAEKDRQASLAWEAKTPEEKEEIRLADEKRKAYQAELAKQKQLEWDAKSPEEQAEILAEKEAKKIADAERKAKEKAEKEKQEWEKYKAEYFYSWNAELYKIPKDNTNIEDNIIITNPPLIEDSPNNNTIAENIINNNIIPIIEDIKVIRENTVFNNTNNISIINQPSINHIPVISNNIKNKIPFIPASISNLPTISNFIEIISSIKTPPILSNLLITQNTPINNTALTSNTSYTPLSLNPNTQTIAFAMPTYYKPFSSEAPSTIIPSDMPSIEMPTYYQNNNNDNPNIQKVTYYKGMW